MEDEQIKEAFRKGFKAGSRGGQSIDAAWNSFSGAAAHGLYEAMLAVAPSPPPWSAEQVQAILSSIEVDESALDKAAREAYAVRCKTHGPRVLEQYASADIMRMQIDEARVIVSAYLAALSQSTTDPLRHPAHSGGISTITERDLQ